jgi:hypothetical protein
MQQNAVTAETNMRLHTDRRMHVNYLKESQCPEQLLCVTKTSLKPKKYENDKLDYVRSGGYKQYKEKKLKISCK